MEIRFSFNFSPYKWALRGDLLLLSEYDVPMRFIYAELNQKQTLEWLLYFIQFIRCSSLFFDASCITGDSQKSSYVLIRSFDVPLGSGTKSHRWSSSI